MESCLSPASTTSRRHRWTNMMIYQNDRGNTIPLLQDVLLLCKISHYHTLSTLVSPAKTFVSLVNQPCDHGSKWAGLGWSQMGNTLQWKITLFFSRKRNMRISGFNILLSQILCSGFRPTRTRIQNRFKYLLRWLERLQLSQEAMRIATGCAPEQNAALPRAFLHLHSLKSATGHYRSLRLSGERYRAFLGGSKFWSWRAS